MLKSMDYIIDLGPDGGDKGGKLIAKGTPEEVANSETSLTGKYLKEIFKKEANQKIKIK
jgi:excinuclease ABC subunit A